MFISKRNTNNLWNENLELVTWVSSNSSRNFIRAWSQFLRVHFRGCSWPGTPTKQFNLIILPSLIFVRNILHLPLRSWDLRFPICDRLSKPGSDWELIISHNWTRWARNWAGSPTKQVPRQSVQVNLHSVMNYRNSGGTRMSFDRSAGSYLARNELATFEMEISWYVANLHKNYHPFYFDFSIFF
jgi:hypothetical protein